MNGLLVVFLYLPFLIKFYYGKSINTQEQRELRVKRVNEKIEGIVWNNYNRSRF